MNRLTDKTSVEFNPECSKVNPLNTNGRCPYYDKLRKFEDFMEEMGFKNLKQLKELLSVNCKPVKFNYRKVTETIVGKAPMTIYEALAEQTDNLIIDKIEKVFAEFGILLNKEKFMEVLKLYTQKEG